MENGPGLTRTAATYCVWLLFLLASSGVTAQDAQLEPCPPGQIFCLKLLQCIWKEQCAEQTASPLSTCHQSETFCVSEGRCVPLAVPCRAAAAGSTCGPGLTYCATLRRCVTAGGAACPPADLPLASGWSPCGAGTVFSMSSGRCEPAGGGRCREGRPTPRPPPPATAICPPDTVFCITEGRCVSRTCTGQEAPGRCVPAQQTAADPAAEPCPRGHRRPCRHTGPCRLCPQPTVYCMLNRRCLPPGQCDPGARACPKGTLFCPETGHCVSAEPCRRASSPTLPVCPAGTAYCLARERCVPPGECCGGSARCPAGAVYCLRTRRCSSSGWCAVPGRSRPSCPGHQVYCASAGRCLPPAGCRHRREAAPCPSGQVLCLASGRCLPPAGCRHRREAAPCPSDQVYCLAESRCVKIDHCRPAVGAGVGTEPPANDTSTGGEGTEEETSTSTGSTTTGENAWSPVDECGDREIFCPATDTCQPGEEPCGHVCPPSHVVCKASCVSYRDCKEREDTGLAWTLPVPVIRDSGITPAPVTLSSLVHSEAAETLLETGNAPGGTVTGADPGWTFSKSEQGPFLAVTVDTKLMLSHYIQYQPPAGVRLGISRINLTQYADESTELQYRVVQYVVPAAGDLVSVRGAELSVTEDEPATLQLSDLVTVTGPSDLDTARLVASLKDSRLDRAAVGYRQLRDLVQPTLAVTIGYSRPPERRSLVPGRLLLSYSPGHDSWVPHPLEERELVVPLPRNSLAQDQPRLKFIPKPNFHGPVSFVVRLRLAGEVAESEVSLSVEAANDSPERLLAAVSGPVLLLLPLGSSLLVRSVSQLVSGVYGDADGSERLGAAVLRTADLAPLGRWQWAPAGSDVWSELQVAGGGGSLVRPQYLAADDLVRFTADNGSLVWTEPEAAEGAQLLITGWDGTDAPANISLPDCQPACGGAGSLAASAVHVTVLRSDCTGLPVPDRTLTSQLDMCGICGGDGSSCLDCNNDINGTAYTDCLLCVGGGTGLSPQRDCAHQCNENHLVPVAGTEQCVPRDEPTVQPCDETTGSGAYINRCGHCVLGSTGRPATYGEDGCGQCAAEPESAPQKSACLKSGSCDGAPASPRRLDRCGQCRDPADPRYSGCTKFGRPPAAVDVSLDTTVVLPARNQTSRWDPTLVSCRLTSTDTGQHTDVATFPHVEKEVRFGATFVTQMVGFAIPERLPLGAYDFSCGDMTAAASFHIVNSSQIGISTLEPPEMVIDQHNVVSVTLTSAAVTGAPVLLGLVSPPGVEPPLVTVPLTAARAGGKWKGADGSLQGHARRLPAAGLFTALLAYNEAGIRAQINRGCGESCRTVRVVAPPPRIVGAQFPSPYTHLTVDFDGPVWAADEACDLLLTPKTLSALGKPECRVRADRLLIRPGREMAAPSDGSLELRLAEGGGIRRRGAGDDPLAAEASGTGTVNITAAAAKAAPEFSLQGPAVVCAGPARSGVTFRAITLHQLGRPLTYAWNVTLAAGASLTQADTLQVWQAINEVNSRAERHDADAVSTYTIDTSPLPAGSHSYRVYAAAESWLGGSRALYTAFSVSEDHTATVIISGPERVRPDAVYQYQVSVQPCQPDSPHKASYKFAWRLPGVPASSLMGVDSPTLRLDTTALPWQTEYLLSCAVTDTNTGDVLTGQLRLRPVSAGVEARLPAGRRAVPPGRPVRLDGSGSVDLAGRSGPLVFSWSCRQADTGAGCFVGTPESLERLEVRLGREPLSLPVLSIPADLLPAQQLYRLSLRVEKDGDADEAYTDVYIESQPAPSLWIDSGRRQFSPYQPVFVSAQVSTDWPVSVMWETDYPLSDEVLRTAPFVPHRVPAGALRRPFDLVLPALETADSDQPCRLCGETIRFRLRADLRTAGDEATQQAAVDVQLSAAPTPGQLRVKYDESGLITVDASDGWTAPPGAETLNYEFGYQSADGTMSTLTSVSAEVPQMQILVPKDAEKVFVRACSADGMCTTAHARIETAESDISSDRLRELLVSASQLRRPSELLVWSEVVLDRQPPEGGRTNHSAAAALPAAVHSAVRSAHRDITQSLQNAVQDSAFTMEQKMRAVEEAVEAVVRLRRLDAALPQYQLSELAASLQMLAERAVLPPPDAGATRRAGRRRRAAESDQTAAVTPLTATQALRLVHGAEDGSASGLLSSVRTALAGLCGSLPSVSSAPLSVRGGRLQLMVARRRLDDTSAAWWPFVAAEKGTAVRGSPDWSGYRRDCGADPETGQPTSCRDACLATWLSAEDLYSQASDRISTDATPRRTAVYTVRLLSPETAQPVMEDDLLKYPFIVQMALNETDPLPKGMQLECRSWSGDQWLPDDCSRGAVTAGWVRCRCRRAAPLAAFQVPVPPATTTAATTTTAAVPTTATPTVAPKIAMVNKSFTITINGSLDSVVGTNEELFKAHFRSELAAQLNISEDRITIDGVREGSVLVDVTMQIPAVTNRARGEQDTLEVLTQLVKDGKLQLTDLQGNRLVIPRDGLDGVTYDPVKEEDNTRTAVIITACIAAILVCVIVGVIAAVLIKNKKRSKVGSVTGPGDRSQHNTYKSFQFEHVMDGTAASLEKYKSSSRGMDDSDRYLAETMRGHSAVRRGSVPRPARYDTPSREQLDATRPIPETVQEKIQKMQNRLPGTPEESWDS